jgi:hypothetical protein
MLSLTNQQASLVPVIHSQPEWQPDILTAAWDVIDVRVLVPFMSPWDVLG